MTIGSQLDEAVPLLLVLEYDGTSFSGSQFQPGLRTVQGELEKAIARLTGEGGGGEGAPSLDARGAAPASSARASAPVRAVLASRTDKGVHAKGQVALVRTRSPLAAAAREAAEHEHAAWAESGGLSVAAAAATTTGSASAGPGAVRGGLGARLAAAGPGSFGARLNGFLPEDLAVVGCLALAAVEGDGFDPRERARGKWYRYTVAVSSVRPVLGRGMAWFVPLADTAEPSTAVEPAAAAAVVNAATRTEVDARGHGACLEEGSDAAAAVTSLTTCTRRGRGGTSSPLPASCSMPAPSPMPGQRAASCGVVQRRQLDVGAMVAAAAALTGRPLDFTSFANAVKGATNGNHTSAGEARDPVCTLEAVRVAATPTAARTHRPHRPSNGGEGTWEVQDDNKEEKEHEQEGGAETVVIDIRGSRFLYNMVRVIVGTLVDVGLGKLDPDIAAVLDAKDRRAAGRGAPAKGLCLMQVLFE